MGLLNNIIACYVLAFALVCHGSLLLCIHQQINKPNTIPLNENIVQATSNEDNSQYNCPQFPDQLVTYTKLWLDKIPIQMIQAYLEIYRLAGTETVNFLIWFGTIALLGDIILLIQYTILKPIKLLKSILGALVRLAIIAFIVLFVIYCLSEQGILPKYQFLEELEFLQLNNIYQIVESSSRLSIKKIKQLLKKYM
ncbi:transmembrane protein, putative (macronuclear) [Tetrahymena thermophila SB210]|uniref:Transmembrane protein, putative n=1 Tax=Tetrahymena thermophila (strain SB210) TaxID=312017 RepID=I7M8P9_TETTS|nr:transmembrane protein, putative [Tetrahymena thermophila SB210]EAR99437.2 transmembrane protein, putative [Tetrahymena thermophila SB210]|eukprot:XP_001019682.2 transmembrane protein, putative [Tetrahymena thermophila SB210]